MIAEVLNLSAADKWLQEELEETANVQKSLFLAPPVYSEVFKRKIAYILKFPKTQCSHRNRTCHIMK